jgi:phosphoribosylformimino-5-aminoimidazole carboxamide ribotide isomerase
MVSSDDVDGWAAKFSRFPIVQVIDLDAALGRGSNDAIVRRLCAALPCQVGGGVRTVERGAELLAAGAKCLIVGSALFSSEGANVEAGARFAAAIPASQLIAAVDSRGARVVIHGWKTTLPMTPEDAVRALEPFVGAFLYTHVDTEGLMEGIDMAAVRSVAAATTRRIIAAGGIRSHADVDALDRLGIDAVVGMALYKGAIDIG